MNTQKISINAEQAKTLRDLIEDNVDFSKLTAADVMNLNWITVQLDEVIEEAK